MGRHSPHLVIQLQQELDSDRNKVGVTFGEIGYSSSSFFNSKVFVFTFSSLDNDSRLDLVLPGLAASNRSLIDFSFGVSSKTRSKAFFRDSV